MFQLIFPRLTPGGESENWWWVLGGCTDLLLMNNRFLMISWRLSCVKVCIGGAAPVDGDMELWRIESKGVSEISQMFSHYYTPC